MASKGSKIFRVSTSRKFDNHPKKIHEKAARANLEDPRVESGERCFHWNCSMVPLKFDWFTGAVEIWKVQCFQVLTFRKFPNPPKKSTKPPGKPTSNVPGSITVSVDLKSASIYAPQWFRRVRRMVQIVQSPARNLIGLLVQLKFGMFNAFKF